MEPKRVVLFALFLLSIQFGEAQPTVTNMVIYPNPFCTEAIIKVDLANNDTVTLVVYDDLGRAIRTCLSDSFLPAGSYTINFSGDSLKDGMYLLHFSYGDTQHINKKVVKVTCSTTSVTENKLQPKNISLFPNPTGNLLTIPVEGMKTVIISNVSGQICKTIKTQERTIYVSDLANGVYGVSVFGADDSLVETGKFIKE